MKAKLDSKEIGLDIGLIFLKYLFKTEYLHYGFWSDGLKVDISNIYQAQKNYADFIISHIPERIDTILVVGCGTGKFAEDLVDLGYKVDCVSPPCRLTERAKERLGQKAHIFESTYEAVEVEKKYDLILFSESFQYINMEKAFQNSMRFLSTGRYMLICDFFKKDVKGRGPLGGGHKLTKFYQLLDEYPVTVEKDIDLNDQIAPTIDLVADLLENVGEPVWSLTGELIARRYPRIARILKWKFKKRIEKINRKYFSGARSGESFKYYKTYRLLLLKWSAGPNLEQLSRV
jgi:SAM-dependent methyltransferase